MQILRSKIVPAEQDIYWRQLSPAWKKLSPAKLLIIATPYERDTAEGTTLSKLIQACGLKEGENAHIIMPDGAVSWHAIRAHFSPAYVLMFGLLPAQLGISALFALNAPNHFNGCIFVPTIAPLAFSQDATVKKNLWERILQPAFSPR